MWVVVVIVESPVPRVNQIDYCQVPVPELAPEGFHDGRVLFVRAEDGLAAVDHHQRVVVDAGADGDEDEEDADDRGDVQPETTAEGRGSESGEYLIPGPAADQFQWLVREDIAREDEEDGDHDMTRDQQANDGKMKDPKVLPREPPSNSHFPSVGEKEMEIEDQETGPSSHAVEGREPMESCPLRRLAAYPVLEKARGESHGQLGEQEIQPVYPVVGSLLEVSGISLGIGEASSVGSPGFQVIEGDVHGGGRGFVVRRHDAIELNSTHTVRGS